MRIIDLYDSHFLYWRHGSLLQITVGKYNLFRCVTTLPISGEDPNCHLEEIGQDVQEQPRNHQTSSLRLLKICGLCLKAKSLPRN